MTGTVVVEEEEEPQAERTGSDGTGAMGAFERHRSAGNDGASIEQVDASIEKQGSLTILFVFTNSEERKFARATAASKAFEENVIGSFEVATAMQGCTNIRFDGTQMTSEIRRAYKLSSTIPQLVLLDINGKVLFKATTSTTSTNLAKMITAAKERVNVMIQKQNG